MVDFYVSCGERHQEMRKNEPGRAVEPLFQKDLPDGYRLALYKREDETPYMSLFHETSFSGGFADIPFSLYWGIKLYKMIRDREDFDVIRGLCIKAEKPY